MFLLRTTNRRWDAPVNAPWLPAGQIHADPLADLKTEDNKLSVWTVFNDASNLQRIVAALAANRENLSRFEYALVDEHAVAVGGFTVVPSPGNTPDAEANKLWHNDVVDLSGNRLVDLAVIMSQHMSRNRYEKDEVVDLIALGIADQRFPRSKLKPSVRATFPETGPSA